MSQLRQLQQSFLNQLLGAPSTIVEHIQSTPDTSAEQRLSIYASGYRLRLKEAMMSDHGCLHGYLGDQMFEQLMDDYIDRYHSQHASLRYYSQHIIELLAQQKPFSDYPELLEIAQIEQAFNNSFDAANCTAIGIEQLAQLAADSWPGLQLQFHASVQLLPCKYNSFPIWKALSEEQTPAALEKENTTWLVWRKGLVSRYRALDDAQANALKQAMEGANFAELCEGLLDYFDEAEIPTHAITYLQSWINEMMVCDISQ